MKNAIFGIIIASNVLFISASIWEGVSMVASDGELPGEFSIATNSFPKNTVVDITNLENGKIVRVLVVSGVESASMLALLSRNVASAMDMRFSGTGRIRISQPPDDVAFSHFRLGPIFTPLPSAEAAQPEKENPVDGYEAITAVDSDAENFDPEMYFAPEYEYAGEGADAVQSETLAGADGTGDSDWNGEQQSQGDAPQDSSALASSGKTEGARANYVMVPTAERPPEPASAYTIPVTAPAPPAPVSPFQAPLIERMEQGKWYVQLGAYSRFDLVEDEISRIGASYPIAIQNIGTDTKPLFRVLLGPMNQGESGAMLQRFKSIGYTDAFLWKN